MSSEGDEPLLDRDDLKRAAGRALVAAPLLLLWAGLWLGGGSRAFGRPAETLGLGLALAAVVFATSLVERVGARRAWPVTRIALLVALAACVGTFGAVLQARSSGVELLQDGARVEKGLLKLVDRGFASGLRLPATIAALLASAAAVRAFLIGRRRPRGYAGVLLPAAWVASYVALALIMDPPSSPSQDRLLLLLHGVGTVLFAVELEVAAYRAPAGQPAPKRHELSGVDLALALGVVFVLLLPRGGRLAQDIARANRRAEAQRLHEAAVATPDARAAVALLDASLEAWDDPRVRLDRGLCHAALGSTAEAEEDFELAAIRVANWEEDDGLRAEALVAWGDALFFDYDRAITAIDKYNGVVDAIEHRPELAESHAGLLRHAVAQGRAARRASRRPPRAAGRHALARGRVPRARRLAAARGHARDRG